MSSIFEVRRDARWDIRLDMMRYRDNLQQVKDNYPDKRSISIDGTDREYVRDMTDGNWEEIGRYINNNTYLRKLCFIASLNNQKMTALFRLLTRGNSIKEISLRRNEFGLDGVRSMVPFLQNAGNLKLVDVSRNNIGSDGFNTLFRALCDSPIEDLDCDKCGIDSIEIDGDRIPLNLRELDLTSNRINANGCRELAKLLQGGDSTLKKLHLDNNNIDDECVEILVNALKPNTSLKELYLESNRGITTEGRRLLLKLVNDVSSIKATLQSNHTLRYLSPSDRLFRKHINAAIIMNRLHKNNPEAAGRAKVICTQLNSVRRNALCKLQGVNRSLYSEINHGINPLHLPEILSLVGQNHGQEELYAALKSSVAGLISTVNRKQCIQERRKMGAELENNEVEIGSNKRHRR
jgi:Ran GTPase-activating protein (RanGAP) involved in mRNA processing and transport